MSKIKVGDKIRMLIDGGVNWHAGDIFTVTYVDGSLIEAGNENFETSFSLHNLYHTFELVKQNECVAIVNNFSTTSPEEIIKSIPEKRIDSHYDFFYELSKFEAEFLQIKIDPYFVASQWRVGERDPSGILFHILKTIARFGDKNSEEREIKAIYLQIKRLAELKGIEL